MESNPEIKVEQQEASASLKTEAPGKIEKIQSQIASSDRPWEEWVKPILEFLAKLPDDIGGFFSDYKKPLLSVVLIISALVTVYVTLAVLDAINDIPLLSPLLELVGLCYTGWFVYRYLLQASTRGELIQEFDQLKSQIMGKNG